MPELPEVEIMRRNLASWWEGHSIVGIDRVDDGLVRRGDVQKLLKLRVDEVRRRGKYLIVVLQGNLVLVVHFRMTGKFIRLGEIGDRMKRVRLIFTFSNGQAYAFLDTRRLGHFDIVKNKELPSLGVLGRLGPEPWPKALEGWKLRGKLKSTRRAIKVAIMDQELIAGVGNIMASEALWRAKIHPETPSNMLREPRLCLLAKALVDVCDHVIREESGSEISYLNDPERPATQNPFLIYGQKTCPTCEGPVSTLKQSGRTTWFCQVCQEK